jgi:hypothetical protein
MAALVAADAYIVGTLTTDGSTANQTWASSAPACPAASLFIVTWAAALGYWRLAKVEDRWTQAPGTGATTS